MWIKNNSQMISKSFWGTKPEATWAYEKLLFSTLKVTV